MVPTNSAHRIIPREQRREDGRRKEGGSDDTRYRRGRGRARGFPPATPPASRGTGLGRKRRLAVEGEGPSPSLRPLGGTGDVGGARGGLL